MSDQHAIGTRFFQNNVGVIDQARLARFAGIDRLAGDLYLFLGNRKCAVSADGPGTFHYNQECFGAGVVHKEEWCGSELCRVGEVH